MLLLQSILVSLSLWSFTALATAIPQPVRDLSAEQKAIAAGQSPLALPSSTLDIPIASLPTGAQEAEHKNPTRNGDPYGLSDFGIDPAHVTSEQLKSLREAGMIRDLEGEERSDKWSLLYIDSWPLLKLCILGATAIAVIKAMLHFKSR